MITYLIKKDNLINRCLLDGCIYGSKVGVLIRVANSDYSVKDYYFIENNKIYENLLFNEKNAKTEVKEILISLGLKVIPDNRNFQINKGIIPLKLKKINIGGIFKMNNNGLFVTDYNTLCANSWKVLKECNNNIDLKNSEKKSIANKNKKRVIKTKDLNSPIIFYHSLLKRLIKLKGGFKNE